MTYEDMYRDMLNECYNDQISGLDSWITNGMDAAELMENNDPIMYRCGFNDWIDSLEDVWCPDCHETFTPCKDIITYDDDVQCPICSGEQFKCEGCDELFDMDDDDQTLCPACQQEESEVKMEMAADLCM